jgi:hypothetical protein
MADDSTTDRLGIQLCSGHPDIEALASPLLKEYMVSLGFLKIRKACSFSGSLGGCRRTGSPRGPGRPAADLALSFWSYWHFL